MKKEKESWTLLWVWTAYLPVKEIKWEFYIKVSDFTRCMDSMRKELEKENKKLKEELSKYKKQYEHSMWFMEEDTLQELKDIWEI